MLIVPEYKYKKDIDFSEAENIMTDTVNKEITVSKGRIAKHYKYVDSALIKNIKWNLMEEIKKNYLKPYDDFIKESYYSKEYLKAKFPTEEEYKKSITKFSTHAVLTPDGEWHEPGEIGWWGSTSATLEQDIEFEKNYEEKFIKAANPEWKLTIVDCHI